MTLNRKLNARLSIPAPAVNPLLRATGGAFLLPLFVLASSCERGTRAAAEEPDRLEAPGNGVGPATGTEVAELPPVKVYKTASCGCCSKWVEHMRAYGYEVEAEDVEPADFVAIKMGAGLSSDLQSCHTAMIGDRVFEGHIPAEIIARFLAEDSEWKGLAVPGMPVGTPGMEAGDRKDPYHVIAFDEDGAREIYESR